MPALTHNLMSVGQLAKKGKRLFSRTMHAESWMEILETNLL